MTRTAEGADLMHALSAVVRRHGIPHKIARMSFLTPPEKSKPAAWLALLLFLVYALAPEVTQTLGWLRDPSARMDLTALLCSAQGPTHAPAHGGKHPARHSAAASCPFCTLQAHQPTVANAAAVPAIVAQARLPWEGGAAYPSAPLEWNWRPAQPRAPPSSRG